MPRGLTQRPLILSGVEMLLTANSVLVALISRISSPSDSARNAIGTARDVRAVAVERCGTAPQTAA